MTASDLFQAGRLTEAVAAQTQAVKASPADNNKRVFLFELLAFAGDLDRAAKQIDAVEYDDPDLQLATGAYRRLVEAERARRALFRDGVRPQFLAPPPDHVRLRLEAVDQLRNQDAAAAARLLAEANAAPPPGGRLNERPVAAVRDCDDLFGPVLEVLVNGTYAWVPLEQVDALAMAPPRFPRDLLWVPARLEVAGAGGDVFLPALYPGSADAADDALRLGRRTDWLGEEESTPVRGVGGRLFLADDDPIGLLEWRQFASA